MTPAERAAAVTEGWTGGEENTCDVVAHIRGAIAGAIRDAVNDAVEAAARVAETHSQPGTDANEAGKAIGRKIRALLEE